MQLKCDKSGYIWTNWTKATDSDDREDEDAASASAQLLHEGRVENHPVI